MNDQVARKHLLIVDDEPVILQILKAVFDDEPVRLTCVGNGTDAKTVLEEQGCDLLITDKNLPDINGLELLQIAKNLNPYTEVIIITGYASLETALTAMEHDAFDYVVKPLNNVFDIRKKVRRALEKQNLALENRQLLEDLHQRNEDLHNALTETKALQSELIQSEKLAGIGTLAAGVAHEVSSPLFGILGLAEAIPDEDNRDMVDSYSREIVGYCQSIREIVVDLSGYSRTARPETSEAFDLNHCIDDAVRLVGHAVKTDGISIERTLGEMVSISGSNTELTQVFVNLIKNAIEAIGDEAPATGGTVRIESGTAVDHVWATVSDNGVGIPEDVRNSVFDPFYTTKPPGKGTGLGLNVAYRIITKYRGTINVEANDDVGTKFHISLPREG